MKQETLEEVAERLYREYPTNPIDNLEWNYNRDINCFRKRKAFINGAKWQQEQDKNKFSEEDMRKAYSIGWITRERFDDLSPDIIYPKGLDYEEKQDYAFNEWFEQFKNK